MRRFLLVFLVSAAAGCGPDAPTPESLLQRSELLLGRDRPAEAVVVLDEAIGLRPGDVELLTQRGIARERAGDLDAAIADYTAAIAAGDAPAALNNRAAIAARRGDTDAALADLEASLAIDPQQSMAHANRAIIRLDAGQPDAAIADLLEVERLAPGQSETARLLGLAYDAIGLADPAGASLTEAVRRDDTSAVAHRDLGRHLRSRGRTAEALASLRRAASLDASLPIGDELAAVGRRSRAEAELTAAGFTTFTVATPPFSLAADGRGVLLVPGPQPTLSRTDVDALRATPDAIVLVLDGDRVTRLEASAIDLDRLQPAAFILPVE